MGGVSWVKWIGMRNGIPNEVTFMQAVIVCRIVCLLRKESILAKRSDFVSGVLAPIYPSSKVARITKDHVRAVSFARDIA